MDNCLAIITARGGSKRIPRKNIRNFLGQPIIKYSIDAALNTGCFDEVMVSTDDREIADIALSFGAKIPFMRSEKTSDDHSTTAEVIIEVLDNYKKIGRNFKFCCCIYPTAPFITSSKLESGYEILKKSDADTVLSVVRFGYPIWRSFKMENNFIKMNWPQYLNSHSQDLPSAFHDCGQFYFIEVDSFIKNKKLFTDKTIPFEIPESEVQDIDNEEDWRLAEIKFRFFLEKQNKQ